MIHTILVNVEHCGSEPEQADTGVLSLMSDVTSSQTSPTCIIHSPFTGGLKSVFLS